jgi:hypothetical protein
VRQFIDSNKWAAFRASGTSFLRAFKALHFEVPVLVDLASREEGVLATRERKQREEDERSGWDVLKRLATPISGEDAVIGGQELFEAFYQSRPQDFLSVFDQTADRVKAFLAQHSRRVD